MKFNFKAIILSLVVLVMLPAFAYGQKKDNLPLPERLPAGLRLTENNPQQYVMTTDYIDYDLLGSFTKKTRVGGQYTRGLTNGQVRWNSVSVAHAFHLADSFPQGINQAMMENFTYTPSSQLLQPSFFQTMPAADLLIKNLVWDMAMFEAFAWYRWDSLKLNTPFRATDINGKIDLAGAGIFENRDVCITWAGITRANNELCAVINYSAMNNAFELKAGGFDIKGRSHYWGSIFVSLSDKQIEQGELFEDVVMDIGGNKANTVRHIMLIKKVN